VNKRLHQLPRAPHNQRPKKPSPAKKVPSWSRAIEREIDRLLNAQQTPDQDGLRCSPNRGMISTKLQGR